MPKIKKEPKEGKTIPGEAEMKSEGSPSPPKVKTDDSIQGKKQKRVPLKIGAPRQYKGSPGRRSVYTKVKPEHRKPRGRPKGSQNSDHVKAVDVLPTRTRGGMSHQGEK